jgi:N-acetyl-anhydromuramyl-L-alanine amidase AmpD
MSLSAQNINFKNFFEENTYQILSAPQVVISKDGISNGEQTFRMNGNDNENDKPVENIFSADYAPALWVSSPNYSSRNGSGVSAVTIHTVQGSYAGCISWFQNTSSNVSAHYVIRSSDGQVTQMVLESNKAWHVGSENPYTVGIEHEGYINNASWYTTAMYQSSANLVKDICTSNGIAKTSCYSGASSSGINVLSSAYKIKGHQHYPNQSHTDPGINWNWGTYYNLINGGTCGTPASLASSSITSTGAVLTWGAVSGATNYSLQIKTSAGSTWTAYTVSGTSYTASGLTAATAYQWKVAANCSGTLSSYSATASFTTANAPSCTSASGLFSTNVGTAVATLNWSVLSGATGYNVRWKISTSGTWTNGTTTGNTLNIASLTPASTYNWEVQRVCSSGAAAWVAGANFTTKASCYDAYESNNSSSTATALSMEQVALAKICGSGDVEWYKVTLTATTSFKFVVSSLPTDYNVELYVGGAYVSGSYNSGTTTESITLTSKPAGTYYFRVYGAAAGNYSNLYDYKVKATTNMSYTGEAKASVINGETGLEENHARTEEMAENAQIDVENLILYPNPAAENCKIAVQLPQASSIRVLLIDTKGSLMSDFTQEGNQGANEISLPIEKLSNGLYIVKMFMLNQNFERKLLIQK